MDRLSGLFDKYKRGITILQLDMEDSASIELAVPYEMVAEFQRITGQNRKNPVSFWRRLNLRERLLEIPEPNAGGSGVLELGDALDYLGNVYARFKPVYRPFSVQIDPNRIALCVEERNSGEADE